jgi:hypothetical protein
MDWLWLVAMLMMGWFGFVIGVQFAFGRDRMHPFLWGITHPTGPPPPWRSKEDYGRPWDRT